MSRNVVLALLAGAIVLVSAGPASAVPLSRAAALEAWLTIQDGRKVPSGWTGNSDTCILGSESQASIGATLNAVNVLRDFAGVKPLSFDPALNRKALAAALIMRANNGITHNPGTNSRCYSSDGKDGSANSNLAFGVAGVNAILAYLSDGPGLGHRRWLLDPTIGTMGTGSTNSTNALYVFGAEAVSPTVPQVVAWPAQGNVPWPLIKGPWSAAINVPGTVDASNPTVEVKIGGRTLPVSGVNGAALGYGWIGRTIEWNVAITAADRGADARIDVTIRGVKVNGVERVFSYTMNAMLAAAPKATTFTGSRTPNSVTVRWEAATPQGVPITGYRVTAFEDGQYPNFVIDQTVGPTVRELTLPYTAPTKTLAVGVFATSRAGSPLQNGFIAVAPPTTTPPATTPTTTPPATTPAPTTTTPRPPPAIVPTIPGVLPIPPPAPVGQGVTATTGARARFVGPVTVRLVGPGRARAGRRLKARSDVRDQQRLSYSWRRNGRPIGGATRSTYRLRRADRGSRISCRLTAVGTDGVAVRRTSQPRLISRR